MNLKINLTDEEAAFLKQYAEVYEEERKDDITANPMLLFKTKTVSSLKKDTLTNMFGRGMNVLMNQRKSL